MAAPGEVVNPRERHICVTPDLRRRVRSEEHTSELQSPCNLVCRLLLEKKKKQTKSIIPIKVLSYFLTYILFSISMTMINTTSCKLSYITVCISLPHHGSISFNSVDDCQ